MATAMLILGTRQKGTPARRGLVKATFIGRLGTIVPGLTHAVNQLCTVQLGPSHGTVTVHLGTVQLGTVQLDTVHMGTVHSGIVLVHLDTVLPSAAASSRPVIFHMGKGRAHRGTTVQALHMGTALTSAVVATVQLGTIQSGTTPDIVDVQSCPDPIHEVVAVPSVVVPIRGRSSPVSTIVIGTA